MKSLITITVIIVITIAIILLIREIVAWYLKINERIRLQKETNQLLKLMMNDQNPGRFNLTTTGSVIDTETNVEI